MSNNRAKVLDAIRAGRLGRDDAVARAAVALRLGARQANLVPARAQGPPHELVQRFTAMAEEAAATVVRVAGANAVPSAVVDYLRRHNLPLRAVVAPHPELTALHWKSRPLLIVRHNDAAQAFDETGVAQGVLGVAETGTLLLHSAPEMPTTINFLPETHIVVLKTARIVGSYEEAFAHLRALAPRADGTVKLPRAVNFITGPSRSADIEQTLQLGAHGPKRLHIVLVDEPKAA